jgi:hypothetical protein
VVSGAAGDDHDALQVVQLLLGHAEALGTMTVPDAVADRLGNALGCS